MDGWSPYKQTSQAVYRILPSVQYHITMKTPKKIKKFYQSARWKKARWQKLHQANGLCEKCGKAGWEVHHIVPLTLANIDKPEIALGLDNLQLLCTSCHNAERRDNEREIRSDVTFDSNGDLIER